VMYDTVTSAVAHARKTVEGRIASDVSPSVQGAISGKATAVVDEAVVLAGVSAVVDASNGREVVVPLVQVLRRGEA
jgi:hypothetical protein